MARWHGNIKGHKSKVSKRCQKMWKVAKRWEKLPKDDKSCENMAKVAKRWQKLPKDAKSCEKFLKDA